MEAFAFPWFVQEIDVLAHEMPRRSQISSIAHGHSLWQDAMGLSFSSSTNCVSFFFSFL